MFVSVCYLHDLAPGSIFGDAVALVYAHVVELENDRKWLEQKKYGKNVNFTRYIWRCLKSQSNIYHIYTAAMEQIAQDVLSAFGVDIYQLNMQSKLFDTSATHITMADLVIDWLTPGQIQLLESVKPLDLWCTELFIYLVCDQFDPLSNMYEYETLDMLSYNAFYYAGINCSCKIFDSEELKELIHYKKIISQYVFPSDVLERNITDYQIMYKTFEECKEEMFIYAEHLCIDLESEYQSIKDKRYDLNLELCEFYDHPTHVHNWIMSYPDFDFEEYVLSDGMFFAV